MANRVNNWQELLKLANEDLSKHEYKITLEEFDNSYTIYIESTTTDKWEPYAEGYYEDELSDLINDAWAHVLAKIKGERAIYYTATALYNNDENHSAQSGVFSSEQKAMEWLKKQAVTWKNDQNIKDDDFKLCVENRRVTAYNDGTFLLYSFEGTVSKVYMDDPEGPLTDVLKRNQGIINKRKDN